jgi:N-acetyl-anhydromuramyl-L-alanine amidase AmpD
MSSIVGYPGAEFHQGKATGLRVDQYGNTLPIRYIVIHGTNSPAPLQWWIDHAATECAVTYMIGKDGRIAQFESDLVNHWGNGVVSAGHDAFWDQWSYTKASGEQAWYANQVSLSIEHEKWAKLNNEPLTPAQAKASFALVAWLCRMYDIPMRPGDASGGVVPHRSVNPVYRSFCPGPYPWDELYASIVRRQYYVPAGWSDSGTALVAA